MTPDVAPTPDREQQAPNVSTAESRTELAWNRSGLAVLVCVLVLLRRLWPLDRTTTIVALVVIAAGATTWSLGLQAARRTGRRPRAPMSRATARLLSAGALALAIGGFVLGLFPPT
jgi:uncharacterized membrane protein YidH (DUF202 family)